MSVPPPDDSGPGFPDWQPRHRSQSRQNRAHLDTTPACNGVVTSSSPFQRHSHGDQDIAPPESFPKGGSVTMHPSKTRLAKGLEQDDRHTV